MKIYTGKESIDKLNKLLDGLENDQPCVGYHQDTTVIGVNHEVWVAWDNSKFPKPGCLWMEEFKTEALAKAWLSDV